METKYSEEDLLRIARKIPPAFKSAQLSWKDKLGKRDASEFPAFFKEESQQVQFDFRYSPGTKDFIEAKCDQESLIVIGYYSQFDIEEMTERQIAERISNYLP